MRPSRTRHRLQAVVAVLGTVAAVYGVSRLVKPKVSSAPEDPRPVVTDRAVISGPIVPRVDPPLSPAASRAPRANAELLAAAAEGDVPAMNRMYTADMNLAGALGAAAGAGKRAAVEWLLGHGADPNEDAATPDAPLLAADAHAEIVALLLARGAKEPPLVAAVSAGAKNAVTRLLRAGADPNAADDAGTTPLLAATGAENVELARALVAHGARVDARAIAHAMDHAESPAMIDVLLARPIAMTEKGKALESASNEPGAMLVKKLAAKGVAWSWRDEHGDEHHPLLAAAERHDLSVVRAMLEAGAPVNAATELGRTPLGAALQLDAADWGDDLLRVVRILLAHGADPNRRLETGERPLAKAATLGNTGVVTLLLDHGARINDGMARLDDETALEAAEGSGQHEVARILRARGARRRPVVD